jgi:hypothetical protein
MHAVPFTLLLAASSYVAHPRWNTRVALAAGSPSPAPLSKPAASPQPSAPPGLPHDRAVNLVGGVWQCETVAGNTGTHTYTENDDGSIELATELRAGFRTFHIHESYTYEDARKLWTVRAAGNAYTGTAGPWTGYKWIFEGSEQGHGTRRALRMVYFDLADQAFRRDFQAKQDGLWRTYSAETCRRPSN